MIGTPRESTLAREVRLQGVGLHTGRMVAVRLLPAEPQHGIVFSVKGARIPAHIRFVREVANWTTELSIGSRLIHTTEHFLAACAGLGVTNCLAIIEGGNELPILDGAAQEWIKAFDAAGLVAQHSVAKVYALQREIRFIHGNSSYHGVPRRSLTIGCSVHFPNTPIGSQTYLYQHNERSFRNGLSNCRTFLKDPISSQPSSLSMLIERLQGFVQAQVERDSVICYTQEEYLSSLRFRYEPVAHKILDFIGDMFLLGGALTGSFTLDRPGHAANIAFLNYLIRHNLITEKCFEAAKVNSASAQGGIL